MSSSIYTLLVGLAMWVGIAYVGWRRRDWGTLTDALIMGVFALALGRVGYATLHYSYFVDHFSEIFSLAHPGYQEHAALAGAGLGWLISGRKVLSFAFCLLPSLIGIAASLACISSGCAYGYEVFWQVNSERSLAWLLAVDWPDAYGISNPRWPTQLFMAGWLVAVSVAMGWIGRGDKETRGQGDKEQTLLVPSSPCLLWLVLFALGDFVIQFFRADASWMWAGLRAEQWLDMFLGLVATTGIVRTPRSV